MRFQAPLEEDVAVSFADASQAELAPLLAAASARRDALFGDVVTFSPKVFLPLTNLCRNRCSYCSFRKSPAEQGAYTMAHAHVLQSLDAAAAQGCTEALVCIGDKPERAFGSYRATLGEMGHQDTVDLIEWASEAALERGLLPHTNAGVLSREDMLRLRPTNVSLGLMLESVSERLCEPDMPHHRAPDKRPALRLAMLTEAGKLKIPVTTGILIGIGETRLERVESLLAIRDLHRAYGHIQEVIVQNFMPRAGIELSAWPAPSDDEMAHAVAMARLILDDDVSVQAPPNLNPTRTELLFAAGINDFGGISPVTPDFINPNQPWPVLAELASQCAALGFTLQPRLPIYPRYYERPGYVDEGLQSRLMETQHRLRSHVFFARGEGSTELLAQGASARCS